MPVVADDVVGLTKFGLYPVRLHYPILRAGEVYCSCGKPECKAQGKHPVGIEWGKSATQESDIIEAQWRDDKWNVGIILGLCHGIPADKAIIDIEDDSLEGRALADTILRDYPCPTYTSGKSMHRLYRWSEGLPPVANMTIKGLEFRFGGKGKETQSVAPPSIHKTGAEYKWIEGKSLEDIELTPLPDHICQYLCDEWAKSESASPGTTSTTDARKFRAPLGKIGPGARHHSLLIEANNLWRRAFQIWGINGIEEQEAIDQVWMWLLGVNAVVCDPPKTEAEVHTIFRSAQSFMLGEFQKELEQKEAASNPTAGEDKDSRSFSAWLHHCGIKLVSDPSMDPTQQNPDRIDEWVCNWQLNYVTKADEEIVELSMEVDEKPVVIPMRVAEFDMASHFARKVKQGTDGRVNLARTFPFWTWKSIWDGKKNDAKSRNGLTRGLREYLVSNAKVESRNSDGAGGLVDQVADIIDAMAGNLSRLMTALAVWENANHTFYGRMKLVPGREELTEIPMPEDPQTGYYKTEDNQILLLLKSDEVNRKYRQSYGNVVNSRQIIESIETLEFVRKKFSHGRLAGRWFMKEMKIIE